MGAGCSNGEVGGGSQRAPAALCTDRHFLWVVSSSLSHAWAKLAGGMSPTEAVPTGWQQSGTHLQFVTAPKLLLQHQWPFGGKGHSWEE